MPAPGQGALGVECAVNSPALEFLQPLIDVDLDRCIRAERGISAGLGADCALPVAAMAVLTESAEISLSALVADATGQRILKAQALGNDPAEVSRAVVQQLYAAGAQELLDSVRRTK